jgi:hypothetical protein
MRRRLLYCCLLLLWAVPAGAETDHLGAHFRDPEEFGKVIDARCAVCHTRERVDLAIRERRDLEKIEAQMVEHGAVLTERDKSVLGTFWGTPLKEEK